MCKLCNTDNPPTTRAKNNALQIIHDYLDEYPCRKCTIAITAAISRGYLNNEQEIDNYIMKKLYLTYRAFNDYTIKKLRNRKNYVTKSVLGITIRTCKTTGRITYTPTLHITKRKKAQIGPIKETFKEALECKINYMVKNNHIHGLKTLQIKLKELKNEN